MLGNLWLTPEAFRVRRNPPNLPPPPPPAVSNPQLHPRSRDCSERGGIPLTARENIE